MNGEELLIQVLRVMDEKDSIEIGSPSKGGKIKVYGNLNRPDEMTEKLRHAVNLVHVGEVWLKDGVPEEEKEPSDGGPETAEKPKETGQETLGPTEEECDSKA